VTGGLYRSAHAARDGDPPSPDGATLISADPAGPVSADRAGPVSADPAGPVSAASGGPAGLVSADPGGAAGLEEPPGQDPPRPADGGAGGAGTAGTSALLAVLSLVSRVLGFVRNALIGMTLGEVVGNAYTTAQFLPGQIYELLLGGILSSVLIPLLVRRRKTEPDAGQAYTQKLLTFAVVGLGAATLLVVAAAPVFTAIQASQKPADFRHLITLFEYLILPIIFFTGLSALIGAVLNVRGQFAAPMWAPIVNNVVVIATCGVFLAAFGHEQALSVAQMTPARIALIGGGTLLGMVAQAAALLPALRRVGFAWRWSWQPRALGLREIGRLAGWMLCYVAANQVAVFFVVNLLNRVPGNRHLAGVLTFNNVFLLTMMAHGIIGVSIMTALLPKMSAAAADGRYDDVKADLTYGLRMTVTALAPIAVVYIVLGTPVTVTLFAGGRFTGADADAAGTVLAVAGFAVLPYSIMQLCTYTFYALQANKTAALINLPVAALRVGSQIVLFAVLPFSLTAAGMTAGNGLSYLVSALVSLSILRRRIGRLGLGAVVGAFARVLGAAVVAGAAGLVVVRLLPGGDTPGKLAALAQVVVGGGVVCTVYLAAAYALRVHEVGQVVGMVRRRLGR
jgi:putative peptidoglycan lipid II flippase